MNIFSSNRPATITLPWLIVLVFLINIGTTQAEARHVSWLEPAHPHVGDTLRVWYRLNDRTAAFHGNPVPMVIFYLFADFPEDPSGLPVPIVREAPALRLDTALMAPLILDVPNVRFILYKFDSGDELDDNNGELWNSLIYDKNDQPVERALECRAWAHTGFAADSGYRIIRDIELARADAKRELQIHPASISAWDLYFSLERVGRMGISIPFADSIDSVMNHFASNPTEFSAPRIAKWYTALGRRDKLISFENRWLESHSSGNYRTFVEFSRAKSIKNAPDKIFAVKNLVEATARDSGWAVGLVREWLMTYYLQAGQGAEADAVLSMLEQAPTIYSARVANAYVESGKGYDRASTLISAAIAREEKHPTQMANSSITMRERAEQQLMLIGTLRIAAARIAEQQGRTDSALALYAQAMHDTRMSDTGAINGMLRMLLVSRNIDRMMGMMPMLAMRCVGDSVAWPILEKVYARLTAPPQPLARLVTLALNMQKTRRQADFCRHAVRLEAPPFSSTMLDGSSISRDSLRRKVVVMEFWGTWCAPCRLTLPKIDSLYRLYKSNPDVAFLAVSTHEQIANSDSLRNIVRAFLADTSVSPVPLIIPVMMDEQDSIAGMYGVHFYPTYAVIDRDGVVRSLRYSVAEGDVVSDLSFALDMVLHDACVEPR